jgi:uncharacterized Zn-binding protein involved in type VI secretion
MPGVVRAQVDKHIGHRSYTPNPFHQYPYVGGQSSVFANNKAVIRVTDKTRCGDPATGGSSDVFVEGKAVHRVGDSTGGHGSFVANAAASGSGDVKAN